MIPRMSNWRLQVVFCGQLDCCEVRGKGGSEGALLIDAAVLLLLVMLLLLPSPVMLATSAGSGAFSFPLAFGLLVFVPFA